MNDSTFSKGCDRITDFNAIDSVAFGADRFRISKRLSRFITAGDISRFTAAEIQRVLPSSTFLANSAASFAFGFSIYLAINDNVAGFDPDKDALIDITGVKGTIDARHFITS